MTGITEEPSTQDTPERYTARIRSLSHFLAHFYERVAGVEGAAVEDFRILGREIGLADSTSSEVVEWLSANGYLAVYGGYLIVLKRTGALWYRWEQTRSHNENDEEDFRRWKAAYEIPRRVFLDKGLSEEKVDAVMRFRHENVIRHQRVFEQMLQSKAEHPLLFSEMQAILAWHDPSGLAPYPGYTFDGYGYSAGAIVSRLITLYALNEIEETIEDFLSPTIPQRVCTVAERIRAAWSTYDPVHKRFMV